MARTSSYRKTGRIRRKAPRQSQGTGNSPVPAHPFFLVGWIGQPLVSIGAAALGMFLILYGMSALDSMTHWMPRPFPFHAEHCLLFAVPGFLLLMVSFYKAGDENHGSLPGWTVLLFMVLILGAGLYLRLHPIGEPNPLWGEDCCLLLADGRSSLDFPDFRPLIYEYGSRQPFLPYCVVLAYAFFPTVSPLMIQKVLWSLVDGLAIGVHYFLGWELGGPLAGLILAAGLALSRPALVNCLSAQTNVTTPLALGLMLLFTFRFFRRVDIRRSLTWGAAVAFGAYCYTATRTYLGWVPVAATLWVLFRPRPSGGRRFMIPALGILWVWTYAYFRLNHFLPAWIAGLPLLYGSTILAAGGVVVWGFLRLFDPPKDAAGKEAGALVLGLVTSGVLMAPMLLHPLWASYASSVSVFNPQSSQYPAGGLSFSFWINQFRTGFVELFQNYPDRVDMGIPNEGFWSIYAIPLVASGLAWALVRRSRLSIFLLGCVVAGFVPHFLSYETHTGRLMGVVTPLLLMGSLAWGSLLGKLRKWGRSAWFAGVLALVLWAGWSYLGMSHLFFVVRFEQTNSVIKLYHSLKQDLPHRRIYLLPNYELPAPYIFNPLVDDSGDLFLRDPGGNAVPRFKDGKSPDVAVYFYAGEKEIRARLIREYPKGRLESSLQSWYSQPKDGPYLFRFYIDGKDLSPNPRFLIHTVAVRPGAFCRRYYAYRFGMGHGIIEHEEWVADPLAPSTLAKPFQTVVTRGTIRIEKAGIYRFHAEGGNDAVLDMDGRSALDYRPTPAKPGHPDGRLELSVGDHAIVLRTYYQDGTDPPRIEVTFPGGMEKHSLAIFEKADVSNGEKRLRAGVPWTPLEKSRIIPTTLSPGPVAVL